jgi:hypothetical protein
LFCRLIPNHLYNRARAARLLIDCGMIAPTRRRIDLSSVERDRTNAPQQLIAPLHENSALVSLHHNTCQIDAEVTRDQSRQRHYILTSLI